MNKLSRIGTMIGTSIIALGAFQSCVDNDYDLDKDMNLVVNVGGGKLSVPGSSTELYSLAKLLDLDPESSIKAMSANNPYGLSEGDYALLQSGDRASGTFEIPEVNVSVGGNTDTETVNFPTFPAALANTGIRPTVILGGADDGEWAVGLKSFVNDINLSESDVNHDIVSISRITTDLVVDASVVFDFHNTYSGHVHIGEGFRIQFGDIVAGVPQFEIELLENIPGCNVIDGHIIRFDSEYTVPDNTGLRLKIAVKGVNCPGSLVNHNFDFHAGITTTGKLYLDEPQPGETVRLDINTNVGSARNSDRITSVTGIVNPVIDIDPINFDINDIPDFLKEDGNVLDIANPQIYLTIDNTSTATVDVNITLTGSYDGAVSVAPVRQALSIVPGVNKICISRTGECATGYVSYANNGLGELIKTIPNSIRVDIAANVKQEETTFNLGRVYDFSADNEVVAPLAFGADMKFTYSDAEDGWNEDLSKYDFNKAEIKLTVNNTAPITFTPKVNPIFKNGHRDGVKVTVNGSIAASSTSTLTILLESNGTLDANGIRSGLTGLDGIEYELEAGNPTVGVNLNEGQGMTFTDITVAIIGGVIVDLNEL